MEFERFERWLDAYKHAWETRDPDAIQAVFTGDAIYRVTPFRDPEMYRDGIRAYWARATDEQRNVAFTFQMIATEGDTGVCRWNVHFDVPTEREHIEIDGIFVFTLTGDELCREFREWWHERTTSLDGAAADG